MEGPPIDQVNEALGWDELAIWEIELDCANGGHLDLEILDSHEISRYERFKYVSDRMRFAYSHIARRKILAQYLNIHPNGIRYKYGRFGKPRLDNGADASSLQFSFSHSGAKALLAIARSGSIGIDLEKLPISIDHDPPIDHVCTINEAAVIRAFPQQRQYAEFLRYWTAKEAYLKATGSGLSVEPRLVEVSSDFSSVTVSTPASLRRLLSWQLVSFEVAGGFQGCLAVSQRPAKILRRVFGSDM